MEPGHEDREYGAAGRGRDVVHAASMEPGHEDREYRDIAELLNGRLRPQWSPVMKTGNTFRSFVSASVENSPQWSPVMKTGNTGPPPARTSAETRLNGARS